MNRTYDGFLRESPPPHVKRIAAELREAGFDVWLVGGALRDLLLGLTPKDWDLLTSASPQDVLTLFPHVIPVGVEHGTVRVHTRQGDVEVTSCPCPGEAGFVRDLGRRDFTMNALAMSFPHGVLHDPFDGRSDILRGTVRAVKDAGARIAEDPLRILRAARFASVLGFKIDGDISRGARRERANLMHVAPERVREEMFRLLLGKRAHRALFWLYRTGVLHAILPEMEEGGVDEGCRTALLRFRRNSCRIVRTPCRLRVRLAAFLLGCFPKDMTAADAVMDRWRLSNREKREMRLILGNTLSVGARLWSDAALRRWLSQSGPDLAEDLLDLAQARGACRMSSGGHGLPEAADLRRRVARLLAARPPLSPRDLAVDGRDVMTAMGLPAGPAVGAVLQRLHQLVLENPELNEHHRLLALVREDLL